MTDIALKSESEYFTHMRCLCFVFLAFSLSLPPWNVEDDGEGKRGDHIARQSCPGRVGPEAILSRATESLILIFRIKMVAVYVGTDTGTELGDRGPDFDLDDKDGSSAC